MANLSDPVVGTGQALKWGAYRSQGDGTSKISEDHWIKKDPWEMEGGVSDWASSRVDNARAPKYFDWRTSAARDQAGQSYQDSQEALDFLRSRSQGQDPSIADMQNRAVQDQLLRQAATAGSSGNPMAFRNAAMAGAGGSSGLLSKGIADRTGELASARDAYGAAIGSQRDLSRSSYGLEYANELADLKDQLAREAMASDRAKIGLGEKLLGSGYEQQAELDRVARDRAGQEIARNMYYGMPEDAGLDISSVLGAIGTTVGTAAAFMSDKNSKNVILSDQACKDALERGDLNEYNFLQSRAQHQKQSGVAPMAPQVAPQYQQGYKPPSPWNSTVNPAASPAGRSASQMQNPTQGGQSPQGATNPLQPSTVDVSRGYGRNRKPAFNLFDQTGGQPLASITGWITPKENAITPIERETTAQTPNQYNMTPGKGYYDQQQAPFWQLGKKDDSVGQKIPNTIWSDKRVKEVTAHSPMLGGVFAADQGYSLTDLLQVPKLATTEMAKPDDPFLKSFNAQFKSGEPYSDNALDMALAKEGIHPDAIKPSNRPIDSAVEFGKRPAFFPKQEIDPEAAPASVPGLGDANYPAMDPAVMHAIEEEKIPNYLPSGLDAMKFGTGLMSMAGSIDRMVENANKKVYPYGRSAGASGLRIGKSALGNQGKSMIFSDQDTKALLARDDNDKQTEELLSNLKPVTYTYKDDSFAPDGDNSPRKGIYTQDLEKSEDGSRFVGRDPATGFETMDVSPSKAIPQLWVNDEYNFRKQKEMQKELDEMKSFFMSREE